MARRRKGRQKQAGPSSDPPSVTEYPDEEGNVLTLRDELTAGTLRQLDDLDARAAASGEDRWQRRVEYLFERLTVRWEIAGLPLEGQKELLGRYRMASTEERRRVRDAIAAHLRAHYPDIRL
jgi:hypothetical protein